MYGMVWGVRRRRCGQFTMHSPKRLNYATALFGPRFSIIVMRK